MLPFAGHCCPSIMPLLFSEDKGPGFYHWNLCIFLTIVFYNYWLKVNTQALFTQQSTDSSEGKKQTSQLARFQAPSLSICKLGLIWVSKHKAKVLVTHRGTFLRSNRLAITHLKLLELCNTERPVMGKEWHDSKWERRKPSKPSSIPQVDGQHWMNHHRAQAFPGSMCYCETFCWAGSGESVWVHALTARQCWMIDLLKSKLSLWRSFLRDSPALFLDKMLGDSGGQTLDMIWSKWYYVLFWVTHT